MSIKTQIQGKIKNEVALFAKKVNRPIKDLAPASEVETIMYNESQALVDKIKANLSGIVNSPQMVQSIKAFKGKANYSITIGADYRYYNAFMLRFFEYGTVQRYRRAKKGKGGKTVYSGMIPARPFMRPAYETMKTDLFNKIQKGIIKSIELKLK